MRDDYLQSEDYLRATNNDPFTNRQYPSALRTTLDDLNEVLQNSEHQKLRQDISNFLSKSEEDKDSLNFLIPAICYKLYGLLAIFEK